MQLLQNLMTVDVQLLKNCETCHSAKQSRLSFPVSTTVSTAVFELVHADVWGPYKVKTHRNCSLFLIVVENIPRTTWVFLLSDKTQVSHLLAAFFA